MFDMHSHILPSIDDGAEDLNEALKILKLMQLQGITDVIATPHFYPALDNLDEFFEDVAEAMKKLKEFVVKRGLPNIYLGCELLYFTGIGQSDSLKQFCLNNSNYLLLELTDDCINKELFADITAIRENLGLEPIIAHVERYCLARNYGKLIRFLAANNIPIQINADSVLIPRLGRVVKKLLDSGLLCVVASDAHSVGIRPPRVKGALKHIAKTYGVEYRERLIKNSEYLFKEIVGGVSGD